MKKIFSMLLLSAAFLMSTTAMAQSTLPADYHGSLYSITPGQHTTIKDTLNTVDTSTYIWVMSGPKHSFGIAVPVDSIDGTIAGDIIVEGSVIINGVEQWKTVGSDELDDLDGQVYWFTNLAPWIYHRCKVTIITEGDAVIEVTPGAIWRALYPPGKR